MKYGRLLTVMGGIAMAVVIFQQYTTSSQSENTTTALARKYAENYQLLLLSILDILIHKTQTLG